MTRLEAGQSPASLELLKTKNQDIPGKPARPKLSRTPNPAGSMSAADSENDDIETVITPDYSTVAMTDHIC